jgi:hypothetical protein
MLNKIKSFRKRIVRTNQFLKTYKKSPKGIIDLLESHKITFLEIIHNPNISERTKLEIRNKLKFELEFEKND